MTDKSSRDLAERLTAARGLVASFDPTSGPDRTRAFLADLTNLFTPGTAEHEVSAAAIYPTPDPAETIHAFQFSVRVFNVLWRNDIRTVGALTECDVNDLGDLRNFGDVCMAEVLTALAARGLKLRNVFAPRATEQDGAKS